MTLEHSCREPEVRVKCCISNFSKLVYCNISKRRRRRLVDATALTICGHYVMTSLQNEAWRRQAVVRLMLRPVQTLKGQINATQSLLTAHFGPINIPVVHDFILTITVISWRFYTNKRYFKDVSELCSRLLCAWMPHCLGGSWGANEQFTDIYNLCTIIGTNDICWGLMNMSCSCEWTSVL